MITSVYWRILNSLQQSSHIGPQLYLCSETECLNETQHTLRLPSCPAAVLSSAAQRDKPWSWRCRSAGSWRHLEPVLSYCRRAAACRPPLASSSQNQAFLEHWCPSRTWHTGEISKWMWIHSMWKQIPAACSDVLNCVSLSSSKANTVLLILNVILNSIKFNVHWASAKNLLS